MLLLFGVLYIFSFTTCKKEQLNTSSGISFSSDTLSFDTLFSTLGSTTRFFTIKNTHKQAIKKAENDKNESDQAKAEEAKAE